MERKHCIMVRCINCGWDNPGGLRNCEKCNAPLTFDVFISYSRKDYVDDAGNALDNNILSKIKDTLKANGISYWFDEEGIYSGDEFASVLTNAIRNSRIFMFISSINSNQSKWTSNEISTAMEFKKPIIPFRIDNSPYNDSVMMKIVSFDYIECRDSEKAMSKMLRAVKHHLSLSISQQKVFVPDVKKILNENDANNNSPKAELEENIKLQRVNRGGKTLFVKGDGEPQFISHWNQIGDFHEGFAKVQDNSGMWGFINTKGEIAIGCNWNSVGDFSEGTATVENEFDQWGYINKQGSLIIPCKWRAAEGFSEGIARVANIEGKWGLIDAAGEQVIPCSWKGIAPCSDGMSIVLDDSNRFGYIDKHGNVAIPCQYHQAWSFTEGMAAVKDEKGKWGAINRDGALIIPFQWKVFNPFSDGLACVQDDNGLYGFIDKNGELIIPCSWHLADIFTEGLARVVNEKGKWGFIDKSGQLVIPCQWTLVIPFKNGTAWVNTGFTARLIDKNGLYL